MNHFMLDLETLGNGRDGAIVTMAMVQFDPRLPNVVYAHPFYARVALNSPNFGTTEPGNVSFWVNQAYDAQQEALGDHSTCVDLLTCIQELDEWLSDRGVADWASVGPLRQNEQIRLWSKPMDFDIRLLQDAYARVGREWPFHRRAPRDMRTLLDLADMNNKVGTAHHALEDARDQVQQVWEAYARIKS